MADNEGTKNVNSLQNALAYFVVGFKTDSKSFIKLTEAWNQKLGGQLWLLLRDRGRLLTILFTCFTKQAILMRRSTVLILPHQVGFPDVINHFCLVIDAMEE